MGTKGLIKYLEDNKKFYKEINKNNKNKAVIDGKNFMHLLYDAIMYNETKNAFDMELIQKCLNGFFNYLKQYNIVVTHIVFDGIDDVEKDKEKKKRKDKKLKKNEKLWGNNMIIFNNNCQPTFTLWFEYQVYAYFMNKTDIEIVISGVDADR